MSYRNKTYIAFDGDNDIRYYRIMQMWKNNGNIDFDFYDAHDLNYSHDWAMQESIKKQLRIRLDNSKIFILLIGNSTYRLTKFVKWEIEKAKELKLPIIAVNLNNKNEKDVLSPSSLENYPVVYIPFTLEAIVYAMKNWADYHYSYVNDPTKQVDFHWDKLAV